MRNKINEQTVLPDYDVVKSILEAFIDYEANKTDASWTKTHFLQCPWGIAWNSGPAGRIHDTGIAVSYLIVATVIGWNELVQQLLLTIRKYYGIDKQDFEQVYNNKIKPNLSNIVSEVYQRLTNIMTVRNNTQNLTEAAKVTINHIQKNLKTQAKLIESLDTTTPYMLRNDGALIACGQIHPYIFMYFDTDFNTNYTKLVQHPEFLIWFYENTLITETRQLIARLAALEKQKFKTVSETLNLPEITSLETYDAVPQICEQLNLATNQEFCRVRTSNYKYKYGGDNGEIYFRISSTNFNWFDLIWNVVNQFKNQLKSVTVMKDYAALGEQFAYYKVKDIIVNKLPVEEFLSLPGNPIIEQINAKALEENIEVHSELNPKLFENGILKPEILQKLNRIANEFLESIMQDNVALDVQDVVLIGSNANYTYSDNSDIDLHIIVNTTAGDNNVYDALYRAYKTIWNNKYDIKIADIPVEVFIESQDQIHISNGCYSILTNSWVQKPEPEKIPKIDDQIIDAELAKWEIRYNQILSALEAEQNSAAPLLEEVHTPTLDMITAFIDDLYLLRAESLATEGEYGLGNIIFKELRNKGYLSTLKTIKNDLITKELSL